ncbi:MAG: Crp/Fnr family transcriptional regulator [Saprospiraceae bacterium]|nr:Crp/Fnr family transcriptional regulator [Saprospiraceae bacterium]MCB9323307.1 Crp/Fnr family transcriptional regulator [Lewinellaceae bacterium]
MMTEQIANEINKVLNLSPSLLNGFWEKLKPLTIQKGSFFLTEGESCRNIALIIKGAFYSYYLKDGNEIIEDFCFEGCFLADYPAFINSTESHKNFRALEDSQLLIISKEELEMLYQSNPNYERAGRLIAEYLFTNWESKLRDTIFLSPTERYKNLLKTRPDILQRAPQYHIAAYLNITPQYLSQIRKKIISETS